MSTGAKDGPLCTKPPRTVEIRRMLLLMNPFGGRGKGVEALKVVQPLFEQQGVKVEVFKTSAAGDMFQKARDADLSKFDVLCILGGDGSIHEAINGLLARPDGARVPLALVPCGTGNSFVTDFKPDKLSPADSAASILQGVAHQVDAGLVRAGGSEVHFFNMVNWPADYMVNAEQMRWMGAARYNAAAFMHILQGRMCRNVRLTIDGEEFQEEVMLVHIQNNKTCGDGLRGAPQAHIDDGFLDVFFVPKTGRISLLSLMSKASSGGHMKSQQIIVRRFKHLSIEAMDGKSSVVNVDGEIIGSDPLSVEVLPAAFEVII